MPHYFGTPETGKNYQISNHKKFQRLHDNNTSKKKEKEGELPLIFGENNFTKL